MCSNVKTFSPLIAYVICQLDRGCAAMRCDKTIFLMFDQLTFPEGIYFGAQKRGDCPVMTRQSEGENIEERG